MNRVRSTVAMAMAIAVGGALAAVLVISSSPIGAASADSTPEPPWISEFKQCQNEQRSTGILFLLDESRSLHHGNAGSDPEGARVDSVKAALLAIESVASSSTDGRPWLKVNVAIDGFGTNYHDYGSSRWAELTASSIGSLSDEAEAFRTRTDERNTDYRAALQGAAAAMGRYRDMVGAPPDKACQLLVWFTDGEYDTDDRTALSNVELAQLQEDVCAPGAAADQLRRDHVLMLATGLSSSSDPTPPDFTWLRRIAEGDQCGSEPRRGDLTEATGGNALLDAILRPPLGPGTATTAQPCATPSPDCADISFKVSSWVSNFRILLKSPSDALQVSFLNPATAGAGVPVLGPASAQANTVQQLTPGVTGTRFTSQRMLLIADRGTTPAEQWQGIWTLQFRGPGAASGAAQLAFIGGVTAAFEGDSIDRQTPSPTRLRLSPSGASAPANDLSTLVVDVHLVAANATLDLPQLPVSADGVVELDPAAVHTLLNSEQGATAGKLYATVAPAAVIDLPEGPVKVDMPPTEASIRLHTGDGYPELLGDVTVNPTVFENRTVGNVSLHVKGPLEGTGTVSLDGFANDLDHTGFTVVPSACTVPTGADVVCSWKLASDRTANRDVRLRVQLSATGTKAQGKPAAYSEPISFSMTRPLDTSRLWRTLVLLLAVFFGVLIAVKCVLVALLARFERLDVTSRVVQLPVRVSDDGHVTAPNSAAITATEEDTVYAFDFQEPFRSKHVFDLTFAVPQIRAMFRHPTFGRVTGDVDLVGSKGWEQHRGRARLVGKVPLNLRGSWVFSFDEQADDKAVPGAPFTGKLLMFIGPFASGQFRTELENAVTTVEESPHLLSAHEHLVRTRTAATSARSELTPVGAAVTRDVTSFVGDLDDINDDEAVVAPDNRATTRTPRLRWWPTKSNSTANSDRVTEPESDDTNPWD